MSTTLQPPAAPARRTQTATPAAARPAPSPMTRLTAVAFVAAPLLIAASSVAWVAGSEPARGVLQFYGVALSAIVILTLTHALAPAFPRAAVALTLLGVLGVAAGAGFAVDNIHGALLDDAYLVDDGGATGALVAQLPGPMFALAWVGIGATLLRAGVRPRWSAIALIVGGLMFPASRIGEIAPLALVDDLLFLVALAPLGLAIVRGRDLLAAR
jgi:hypothetical protein